MEQRQTTDHTDGTDKGPRRALIRVIVVSLSSWPFQVVRFDFPVQRRAFDSEDLGGPTLVPVGVLERLRDVALLNFINGKRLISGLGRRGRGLQGFEAGEPNVA